MILKIIISVLLIIVTACQLPEIKDITPPLVFIVFPYNNSVISDSTFVRVETTDESEITSVILYLDNIIVGQSSGRNPEFGVDVSGFADNQVHVFTATAQDADNNRGLSPQNFVTIANTPDIVPPEVTLVNPLNGQIVKDSVLVVAKATDDRLVKEVAFFLNGDSVSTQAIYPYEYLLDVRGFSDSIRYNIFAKAFDAANNFTITPPIAVTLFPDSFDDVPPTIVLLFPLAGSTVTGTVNVTVDVFDNVMVSRVEFYVDGDLMFVDTSPPWRYVWDTAPWADGGQHTLYFKALDSSDNVGTLGPVSYTVQ